VNGLLAMVESFVDRMTNPLYGPAVNEEYSQRFNQALAEDPEFAVEFANLALDPEDVGSLSACAWPWYLDWRRLEDAPPPASDFLDALFAATDDPAIRLAVMQSGLSERVTDAAAPDNTAPDNTAPGAGAAGNVASERSDYQRDRPFPGFDREAEERPDAIPSRWLRSRVTALTRAFEPAGTLPDAIEVAMYLLQLGDPASLASLRAMLSTRWPGRADLANAIGRQLAEAGLDPETAASWRRELGLDQGLSS
jgi:hypothetical protein